MQLLDGVLRILTITFYNKIRKNVDLVIEQHQLRHSSILQELELQDG